MKKVFPGTMLSTLMLIFPLPTMARVDIDINISLPPPVRFVEPPELVVLPGTYVYAVPDVDVDIFFYDGWWWRSWDRHWYRSREYSSGWVYYENVPTFYREVPPTGGIITGSAVGGGMHGITSGFLIIACKRTGGTGKEIGTGSINSPGVSWVIDFHRAER